MENNQQFSNESGGLIGLVTSLRGLYPVANATVTVFTGNIDDMQVVDKDITDSSGRTKTFVLTTPPKSYSLNSQNTQLAYARYNMLVEADGYISNIHYNIPIFSGITSLQNANLMISETAGANRSPIIFDESQEYNL